MRLSVHLPSLRGPALRDYVQSLEGLGVDFVLATDHVVMPQPRPDGTPRSIYPATLRMLEPLATLAFVAGCTERIGLETGVLILPQRQPALVAKAVATVDFLSGGRMRLGVGVGWQEPEFDAMGVPFRERGARMDEALIVLRLLWTSDHATFNGRFYALDDMVAEPKPVQKPHPPILCGGASPPALRRAGRLANGWIANAQQTPESFRANRERVLDAARRAGRDAEVTIFEAAAGPPSDNPADLAPRIRAFRDAGATDFALWPAMGLAAAPSLRTPEGQIAYLRRFVEEVWPEFRG